MLELLGYEFFRNALAGSLLASIVCGLIGTYIVTRRLVFISGGITHASLGGIGIGLYSGFPPILCAAAFSVLSALGIEILGKKARVREDSAIAVFWTFGMSIGVIFSYLTPGFVPELSTFLFGNILTIGSSDLYFLGGLAIAILLLFAAFHRAIVSVSFDEDFAKANGLPTDAINYMMMALIALSVVACLRIAGIVLVMSMMTIPQLTASLLTSSYLRMILASTAIGAACCLCGIIIAYYLNIPSGASIIFFSIIVYAIARIVKTTIERRAIKRSAQ